MVKMLDTTKINHLIADRFYHDETGKKKNTVNEYEANHIQEREYQLHLYENRQIIKSYSRKRNVETFWTVNANSTYGKRKTQQTKCLKLLCKQHRMNQKNTTQVQVIGVAVT